MVILRGYHWALALTLAAAVHLLGFVWWAHTAPGEGARAAGREGVEVGIGLAGSYMEAQAHEAAEPQPEPIEAQETPDPPPSEPEPEPEPPKPETPEPAPVAAPEPAPVPEAPKPVIKKIDPAPKPQTQKPDPEPQTRREVLKPQDTPPATPTAQAAQQRHKASQALTRATGTGEQRETGGDPGARRSYLNQVLARIARHKRYPRDARRDGATGVVTVSFVILANGALEATRVTKSSGDHRLDKAALDMLQRAAPFPPLPRELAVDRLTLTLPVEFSLHQKRSLF